MSRTNVEWTDYLKSSTIKWASLKAMFLAVVISNPEMLPNLAEALGFHDAANSIGKIIGFLGTIAVYLGVVKGRIDADTKTPVQLR